MFYIFKLVYGDDIKTTREPENSDFIQRFFLN